MIEQDLPLQNLNTLRLVSSARLFSRFSDAAQLLSLQQRAEDEQLPLRVLGGGSNVLMPECVDALVVQNESVRVREVSRDDMNCLIDVDAGMNWHEWVKKSIEYGHGLENLALIPGTVGASPIQNIGAYGVEAGEFIESVSGYQLSTRQLRTLSASECRFGYRDSVFKRELHQDFVILRVRFRLARQFSPVLSYSPLDALNRSTLTPENLISTVCEVRSSKLPDPKVTPNAGSYFKNPLVTKEWASSLKETFPAIPQYSHSDGIKLAAGWMIEQCGFKGKKVGPVAMYEKQALVLTAENNATLADVQALQKQVQTQVFDKFGVWLEPEPQVFG